MGNIVTEACQNFNFNRKSGGSEMVIQAALKDEDKAEVGCVGVGVDGGGEEGMESYLRLDETLETKIIKLQSSLDKGQARTNCNSANGSSSDFLH